MLPVLLPLCLCVLSLIFRFPQRWLLRWTAVIGGKQLSIFNTGKILLGNVLSAMLLFLRNLSFLETLPEKEFNNGLAEIIKYGIIDDEKMFQTMENHMETIKLKESKLC